MAEGGRAAHAARLEAAVTALLAENEVVEVNPEGPVRDAGRVYVARLSVLIREGPSWIRVTGEVPPEPVEQAEPRLVAESILPQLRDAAMREMVRRFGPQG